MATYNGAGFILEQINSVLKELNQEDELVISDDSSTDETVSLIESIGDPRIKLFKGFTGRSPVANFENALSKVSGDYIFLCDQDDIWMPGKVAHCIEVLQNHDIVVTDCRVVNEKLEIVEESFFRFMESGRGLFKNFLRNTYLGCCMAFRKEILPIILPFPKNIPMHDIWIGFVGELILKPAFTNKPLVMYRRHNKNVSSTTGRSNYMLLEQVGSRLGLLSNIPSLLIRYYKYQHSLKNLAPQH